MSEHIELNRVTFALPLQPFKVTAFISTEERLPAVTEFVLRLLHTCGRASLSAFRDYFGFTEPEALSVIEALNRQGYLTVTGDDLSLSEETRKKFESSPDDCPWVTKLKRRTDSVTFDLLTFSMLGRMDMAFVNASCLKLNPPPDIVGNSIEKARAAYRNNFPRIEREIARSRGAERERTYGVHSVESIEPRKANFVPLTVSFNVDSNNKMVASLPREFEAGASTELVTAFRERIGQALELQPDAPAFGVQEFLDLFELDFLRPYALETEVNAYKLASEVERGLAGPTGVKPIYGASYLQRNRMALLAMVNDARSGLKGQAKHLGSLAWLAPEYGLWGRGEDFRLSVDAFRKAIRNSGKGDDLFVIDHAEIRQEAAVRSRYVGTGLSELHLVRPSPKSDERWLGSLELMLYPGRFGVALLHAPVRSAPGTRMPFGIVATRPKTLQTIHNLLLGAGDNNRYAGRWSPGREDGPSKGSAMREGLPFLNYSDIVR